MIGKVRVLLASTLLVTMVSAAPAAQRLAVAHPPPAQRPPVPPPSGPPPGQPPGQQPPGPPPAAPPSAPLPPTPAALSVPDPFAGFRRGPRDLYQVPGGRDRFQHIGRFPMPHAPLAAWPWSYSLSYWPHYPVSYFNSDVYTEMAIAAQSYVSLRGGLVLEGLPDAAQVYVDGYYVGMAAEFGTLGHPMDVAAGAHRIDVRANGYETMSFNVMIAPNDILRYRGDMLPLSPTPAVVFVPAQPQTAKTIYVIPKCYAGDKPPTGPLPPGCDAKNVQKR
jgi:hypothetical protein